MSVSTQRLFMTLFFFNLVIGMVALAYMTNYENIDPDVVIDKLLGANGRIDNFFSGIEAASQPLSQIGGDELKFLINVIQYMVMIVGFILWIFLGGIFSAIYLFVNAVADVTVLERLLSVMLGLFIGLYNILLVLEIFLIVKNNKV